MEAVSSGGPVSLRHSYFGGYDYGATQYTVTVAVVPRFMEGSACVEDYSGAVERSFVVSVRAPWYEYAGIAKGAISQIPQGGGIEGAVVGALKAVGFKLADAFAEIVDVIARWMAGLGLSAGFAFYYYVAMPESGAFPALRDVYGQFQAWALYLLPFAFVASLLWRGFWEWERGGDVLLDSFRDFIAVAIGVYAFLEAYDLLAEVVNVVSLSIAQLGQLGALYAMILAGGSLLGVAGIFSPGPRPPWYSRWSWA